MEQWPYRACQRVTSKQEQNQVTSYSNWSRVLLFHVAHKQCNDVVKGWLHCLTSESKGRFLVNNILMFGSAYLVMAKNQFFVNKKKIGRPEHSLTPTPYVRWYLIFAPPPYSTPSKWTLICVVSPLWISVLYWNGSSICVSSFFTEKQRQLKITQIWSTFWMTSNH